MPKPTPPTLVGEKANHFEFATAGRIVFGCGALSQVGEIARTFGARALIITGQTTSRAERLREQLSAAKITSSCFSLSGEPTVKEIEQATSESRSSGYDMVIGFGGGSAIDGAKAVSALLTNPGALPDYLEVIGQGRPLTQPTVPCLAIPTTAGSGAEVTQNAVITSPEHEVKVSLRSSFILPRVAIVDPELTFDLPSALTASTGLDALTQLIEPYVSTRANPVTDGLCLDGMRRVARSLERASTRPGDPSAREDMALASLFGGMSLANAGLGAVHGFASPIGGCLRAPHGAVCAAILPSVMEGNIQALRLRVPSHASLSRFRYIARILTGKEDASADASVAWVREITTRLGCPRLRDFGLRHDHFPALVEKAMQSNSMKSNPIALTASELKAILDRSW